MEDLYHVMQDLFEESQENLPSQQIFIEKSNILTEKTVDSPRSPLTSDDEDHIVMTQNETLDIIS